MRWEGARQPTVWTVPPPEVDPLEARLELARRYLHVLGPSTPEAFARWAGIRRGGVAAFEALGVTPVRTSLGDAWILPQDEPTFRAAPTSVAPARLLPSGDAYLLGEDRALVVADADQLRELWPSRVWPGGVLAGGEVVGTWRRADEKVTIHAWRRLPRATREAIESEAESLPIPGVHGRIVVRWA
jgi:hypothetical protein